MLAALKNRLKPPPANIGTGEPPDAARVEAELLAASDARTSAKAGGDDFRISVTDQGIACFEDGFGPGDLVIGADPECDIVITDIDAPEVLVMRLERIGAAGMITLTALCHGVVARERELPVGRPVRFPDRARFFIASDYGFEVALTSRPEPLVRAPSGPLVLLAGALLLALAGWLLSAPLPRPDPSTRTEAPGATTISGTPGAAAPVSLPDPVALERRAIIPPAPDGAATGGGPVDVPDEHVRQLRTRLVDANLVPPLIVGREGDGLLVSGALSRDERERAIDVLHAFREAASVTVTMQITAEPREEPFFTAVVLRPETFVIGADGRRYGEGQSLPDGGRIEKIDEKAIVVNRDGLLERVSYVW